MSELKAYRVKGVTLGDTHDVYIKSEADKVIAELKAEKECLKNELLDAKRDACRFEKAMYRALMNWAHARSFIYLEEHRASIASGIPPQWLRVMSLCGLGYEFANIEQAKLPKKPKAPEMKDV